MNFYKLNVEKTIKSLNTNLETGLTNKEAKKRLKKYGPNLIPEKGVTNPFIIFLKQFLSPLMFILLIAAILNAMTGDIKDTIVISIAVAMNVILGFIQEFKAEKSAYALKNFEVKHCNVKRNGKIINIETKNLVPGDIVFLSSGDIIPADIRLTKIINLTIEEAILTGESNPINKDTDPIENEVVVGDRKNIAFMGTSILSGKAEGVVTKTGSNSYLGQISEMVSKTKEEATPLQKQISKLSWFLGTIFLSITIIIFFLGILKGMPFNKILLLSIALAVSAIPEGLLVALTVTLAIGMQRMLKRKALVRHLVAAETLGGVSVICTDKTGTLTQGHMQVVKLVTHNFSFNEEQLTAQNILENSETKEVITDLILNNDAQVQQGKKMIIGKPTEIALLKLAQKLNLNVPEILEQHERVNEIPFSSAIKYMATVNKFGDKEKLIVKGAPEKIFALCKQTEKLNEFKKISDEMAKEGLRILALARKNNVTENITENIFDMQICGLIGIQDPLRPKAKKTVKELKGAGIRIVLITGDHKDTALNIAQQARIVKDKAGILTGEELDKLTDNELLEQIDKIDIFSRVDPRHKIRIVDAWQEKGASVAMTGDGVNDAPALKSADIGVALGSGSEVSHEISDIVLLDDNLSTIDRAVKEGRTIFDNIQKIITFLLTDCFEEILLVSLCMIINVPLPLLAPQILWINLISDGPAYLAFTMEPAEPDIMKRTPRKIDSHLINKEMKTMIFVVGIFTDLILFAAYIILLKTNYNFESLKTILFTAIAINSLFYAFSLKSLRHSIFKINFTSNIWLIWAVVLSFIMQLSVVYFPPLQHLFDTTALKIFDWLIILPLIFVKFILIEITKYFFNKFRPD